VQELSIFLEYYVDISVLDEMGLVEKIFVKQRESLAFHLHGVLQLDERCAFKYGTDILFSPLIPLDNDTQVLYYNY
jgi:hypothetical protein